MLEVLTSPVGISLTLLVVGVVLGVLRRQSRLAYRLLIAGAVLLIVFTCSPLADLLMRHLEIQFTPMFAPPRSPEVERIVVLAGGAGTDSGIPVTSSVSGETLVRLSEALRLYHSLPQARLIVSGGAARRGDPAEATLMARFLVQVGVPAEDVLVEGNSRNTYENMLAVQKFVGARPFVLVTSAYHLPRAMAVARRLGMHPLAAPAGIWALQQYPANLSRSQFTAALCRSFAHPSTDRLQRLQWAYHEYVGYLWYWVAGRV